METKMADAFDEIENTETEKDKKISRRISARVGSEKKKFRVLSQRKRKSSPSVLSVNDNVTIEHYLQLADKHYSARNLETASKYYSVVLGRQMEKEFTVRDKSLDDTNNVFDENNNSNMVNDREPRLQAKNREWAEQFLETKFMDATQTIAMSTNDPKGYLEKAAVLFFQNKWDEARKILETGMLLCTGSKTVFKSTIDEMDKILRSTIEK